MLQCELLSVLDTARGCQATDAFRARAGLGFGLNCADAGAYSEDGPNPAPGTE